MRKELAKAVRAEFTAAMNRRLPQFVAFKVASRYAWPGSRVFRWIYGPSLHFFVEMMFEAKGAEAFSVEIGWSRLGRYPEVASRPGFPLRGIEFGRPEHWSRLPSLYARLGGFWSLEEPDHEPGASGASSGIRPTASGVSVEVPLEEAMARVPRRVEDAVDKLVRHGLPYFEEVARMDTTPSQSRE